MILRQEGLPFMALCEIRWYSRVLDQQVGTLVILPEASRPPFATFYLLHGRSDDYTTWLKSTRIESYAAAWPFIIVMPDGFNGYYTNNDQGPAYATYIGEELVEMIQRNFPAIPKPSARCIGGQSMGAYGALRIALGYAGKFTSASAHSGPLMAGSRDTPPKRFPNMSRIFSPHPRGTEHDLIFLARQAKQRGKLPRISIDCGQEDHLLQDNRDYHQALEKLEVPHHYKEFPGGHNWDYWDQHVRDDLEFHARAMRKKRIGP
jgi:putative tributyrin esterase